MILGSLRQQLTCPTRFGRPPDPPQYDLYSKSNVEKPDAESLWPFYQTLVDKYLGPGKFWW